MKISDESSFYLNDFKIGRLSWGYIECKVITNPKCGRGGRKVHIRVTVHEKIIPTTVDFENNREVWGQGKQAAWRSWDIKDQTFPKPSEKNTPLT